ncbi:MAG: hypothetical protein SXV54_02015 [Chloroflexota bacterium]|nr:hypothetical protein [Chloroflexota bacterium]
MRWKKSLVLFTICAVLSVLLYLPFTSYAQGYSFSLDQEIVDVWINQDGSVTLEYWFTFTCDVGNYHIAAVDVGLPNNDYNISDISGDVDGKPIDHVGSDFEGEGGYGVAVWLGDATIKSGETATVHVVVDRVGSMVYEDDDDAEYASTQFSPAYFVGSVHGNTDLTVYLHLPEGVQPEEPRWHRSPAGWPYDQPETALDGEGRVLYTWHNPAADPERQYMFGASFPRQYVAEGAIQEGPSALEGAFTAIAGCCCNPMFIIPAIFAGIIGLSTWSQRRRKMQYLPPSMKVEGVGIKRGLTAVEAAILLETPLDKVLTMILFGLLKKGAVTVLDDKPLKIQIEEPLPEKLHLYEEKFLKAVKKDHTLSEGRLRSMMTGLIKAVNSKMKGFSRKETMTYYQDLVKRAWEQVEGAETPEVRSERFDEGLEWAMLDEDFDDRTERVFRTGPVYVPMWWGRYRPWAPAVASASSKGGRAPSISTGSQPRLPTLPGAAFAATMVRGIENTSSRIVRSVTDFTGGVTRVTNPPPKPSSSGRSTGRSSGRSGGSSCACACACACAGCACACAGGGR